MKLTFEDAVRLANDAVVEKGPDYVYERVDNACVNVWKCDETDELYPSCIVGNILHRAGVSLEDLWYNAPESDAVETLATVDVDADYTTTNFLSLVQFYQDHCTPWGEAVVTALQNADKDNEDDDNE